VDATATDNVIENEADEHPRHIIKWRCRWNEANGAENDREVEILEKRQLKLLVENPLDEWRNSARKEEEEKVIIEVTVREETMWSNNQCCAGR
jgi:hypothetical protein